MPPLKKSPAPVKITAKKRPSAAVEEKISVRRSLPAANESEKSVAPPIPAISPAAAAHVAAQARLTEAAESPVEERELRRIQPEDGEAQEAQSGVEGAQSGVESGASGTESAESPASAGEVSPASAKAEEETEK